jgi:hypothetical protein
MHAAWRYGMASAVPTLTQQYGMACYHNLTDMLATEDMSVHCVHCSCRHLIAQQELPLSRAPPGVPMHLL